MGIGENVGEGVGESTSSSGSSLASPLPPVITSFTSTSSSVRVTWTNPNPYSVMSYTTYIYNFNTDELVDTNTSTGTSYTLSGLPSATPYVVAMTCIDGERESGLSNTETVTTSSSTSAFQLPSSNFTTAQMPPVIVHPRPEAGSDARYRWAHSQMEYSICVGVQGGAWPFLYELTTKPTGMTIGQTYGTTVSPNADYGIIRWPASYITSGNHTVAVRVTDQDGTQVSLTFTVTINDSKFVFIEKGGSGDGTYNSPKDDISDVINEAGKIVVFKNSSTQYEWPTAAGNSENKYKLSPASNPFSWIAESYNSTAVINFADKSSMDCQSNPDFLLYGLTTSGIMNAQFNGTGADVSQQIVMQPGSRSGMHRCRFTNIPDNTRPTSYNHAVMFTDGNNNQNYYSIVRCVFDGMSSKQHSFTTYDINYFVVELCVLQGNYRSTTKPEQVAFYTKSGCRHTTFRANDLWTNNSTWLAQFGAAAYAGAASPYNEELCWNKLNSSYNNDGILITHAESLPTDTYNYFIYRNTFLMAGMQLHKWSAPTNATEVWNNVVITNQGQICTGNTCQGRGTVNAVDNLFAGLSGQTTVDETTGLLISDQYRGLRGHEVIFE